MPRNPWPRLGLTAFALGAEAAQVIALRSMKLAAGGRDAQEEAQRMVAEKIDTAVALQTMAFTGALGLTLPTAARKSMSHVRRKVRANRRRLSKI